MLLSLIISFFLNEQAFSAQTEDPRKNLNDYFYIKYGDYYLHNPESNDRIFAKNNGEKTLFKINWSHYGYFIISTDTDGHAFSTNTETNITLNPQRRSEEKFRILPVEGGGFKIRSTPTHKYIFIKDDDNSLIY